MMVEMFIVSQCQTSQLLVSLDVYYYNNDVSLIIAEENDGSIIRKAVHNIIDKFCFSRCYQDRTMILNSCLVLPFLAMNNIA
jgi:predicted DNA-binding protein YlxM (UPF0122 family)